MQQSTYPCHCILDVKWNKVVRKLTMNNLAAFGILALCFAVSYASTPQHSNYFIDSIINQHLVNELRSRRLDVAYVNNFSTQFKDKITFITVTVKTDYQQGNLTGLTKAYRLGNCGAPYYSNVGRNVTLNCTLSFDNLELNYNGKAKYGSVPTVSIKVKANVTRTIVSVQVTKPRYLNGPNKLTKFDITTMGIVRPTFSGVGPLNSALKMLTDTFASQASGQIHSALYYNFQPALDSILSRAIMPMPR